MWDAVEEQKEVIFDDQSLMPFGKYKGEPLEEVPASYLLWLWENTDIRHRDKQYREESFALHDYIRDNFDTLTTECPDLIIQYRP